MYVSCGGSADIVARKSGVDGSIQDQDHNRLVCLPQEIEAVGGGGDEVVDRRP